MSTKKDAPSGTLLKLVDEMKKAGYRAPHRYRFQPRRRAPRHARDRLRFRGRYHHAAAHRPQPRRLRPRRFESRAMGDRQEGISRILTRCCPSRRSAWEVVHVHRMRHRAGNAVRFAIYPSTRLRSASWSVARSRPESTFWSLAAPPARAPRSPAPSISASSEITLEEARGRVPVLAGAGGYNTHEVIELARELERLGVDGILSVTPYYNKPTQEGLYQHYQRHRRRDSPAHRGLQRARPHRRERRARYPGPPGRHRKHRRRQGSLRQYRADGQCAPRSAFPTSPCSPATTPSPSRSWRSAAAVSSPWSPTRSPPK